MRTWSTFTARSDLFVLNITFDNKVVLVTGASRGIGKCLAAEFKDLGAKVIRLSSSMYDFRNKEDLEKLSESLERFEQVDVCVNNAGINKIDYFDDIALEDYDDIMNVNVRAPFMISQVVAKKMKKQNYGRIVNITSIFGSCTREKRACYTTSKYALTGMTKTLAIELASHGVLVNSVAPGFTKTELTERILGPEGIREVCAQLPIGRLASPSEVSKLVLFLCSEHNTYLTGQNIFVDGGFVCV